MSPPQCIARTEDVRAAQCCTRHKINIDLPPIAHPTFLLPVPQPCPPYTPHLHHPRYFPMFPIIIIVITPLLNTCSHPVRCLQKISDPRWHPQMLGCAIPLCTGDWSQCLCGGWWGRGGEDGTAWGWKWLAGHRRCQHSQWPLMRKHHKSIIQNAASYKGLCMDGNDDMADVLGSWGHTLFAVFRASRYTKKTWEKRY